MYNDFLANEAFRSLIMQDKRRATQDVFLWFSPSFLLIFPSIQSIIIALFFCLFVFGFFEPYSLKCEFPTTARSHQRPPSRFWLPFSGGNWDGAQPKGSGGRSRPRPETQLGTPRFLAGTALSGVTSERERPLLMWNFQIVSSPKWLTFGFSPFRIISWW